MDKRVAEISIAGFLHDIGKVSQRAKIPLTEQSQRMKESICPTRDGRHTHLHTPLTNQFFESEQGWLPRELDHTSISNLATYHHRPRHEEPLDFIIQQADWYSSGQDRGAGVENPDYITGRMNSIFEQIKLEGRSSASGKAYMPIQEQSLDESIFPDSSLSKESIIESNKEIYEKLVAHISEIKDVPSNILCEQLEWIFSQYCWCVPSSAWSKEFPDISLLDHSKTTAGIAACLYQYHNETNSISEKEICDKNAKKFIVVSGDFSGIQNYIFHNVQTDQKGTSKRLRARSFYIGVIGRVASSLILDELGLPCFCRFMEAGGRFTLLVANTQKTKEKLKSLSKKMDTWLFETFNGLLRLNMSFALELSGSDFMMENYKAKIQEPMARDVDIAKRRQFSNVLIEDGVWNREKFVIDNNPKEFDKKETEYFNKLGEKLPKANYLLVADKNDALVGMINSKNKFSNLFGMRSINFSDKLSDSEARTLKAYYQIMPNKQVDPKNILSGLYVANYVPRIEPYDNSIYKYLNMEELIKESGDYSEDSKVKTFAHIAADSCWIDKEDNARGSGLLGVLKADVDNLGLIFSEGIGDRISVSRVASLSRQIDMFFKGFLTNQLQTNEKFRNIYTVYAGGDDLLFVGPWNTMFEFGKYIRDSFSRYTCNNDSITISASIILCKSSYPLAQAACEAEEGLEAAKDAGRNRITVFGETLEWDDYIEALKNIEVIDNSVNGKSGSFAMSSSFAYKLIKYARMAKDANSKNPKLDNLKWRSQLSYDIGRNIKPKIKSGDAVAEEAFDKLKMITGIEINAAAAASKLLVSASYSTYKNRRV